MAELKTKPTTGSVAAFLEAVADETRRNDALALCKILEEVAGAPPKMWGRNIVGFGERRLKYASGRELDWPPIAFAPRKQNLTLYLSGGFERLESLLARFGKHSHGKGCLHFKRLADVDATVLRELVRASLEPNSG